jgi:hypothetical protein
LLDEETETNNSSGHSSPTLSYHDWPPVLSRRSSPEIAAMPLTAFKEDIVIAYLMTKFLMGPPEAFLHGADVYTTNAVLLTRDASAAYTSGLSLAEAFFGRMHKLDDMTAHSAKLYSKALRRLQRDLQNRPAAAALRQQHSGGGGDAAYLNLWSSLFLGLYEMVLGATALNWLQHSIGVGVLVSVVRH